MWNETTMNENGNGWAVGESSFMTDRKQDSKSTTLADRLPVPATISMLHEHFESQDDKYVLGGFRFATVITVGIVKEIHENDTNYTYVLCDPNNSENEFRASKFVVEGGSFDPTLIVEGSRVRAIGKLKGFDGVNTIMSFVVTPMDNDKDFTIFELEAQAARLFFSKNMNDKLKSEQTSNGFQGMLAPPKSRTPAVSQQNSAGSDTKERIFPVQEVKKDSGTLFQRIDAVLSAIPQDNREVGSHITWISEQVREPNHEKIREIMLDMIEGGKAYTTIDEDSFSVI